MNMTSPFLCTNLYTNVSMDELREISMRSLGTRVYANAGVITVGSVAFLTNIFVVLIVWRSKPLRTKCFCLIATNSLVDCLLGGAYAITAAKRIYRYASGVGEVMNRWCCFCEVQINGFLQLMSLAMAVVLVVDRFVAIVRPIPYKQMSYRRLTVPLIGGALGYSSIQYAVNFYDAYSSSRRASLIACGIDDTLSSGMLTGLIGVQIATSFSVLVLNLTLVAVIRKQRQSNSTTTSGEKEQRAFKIISATALVHVVVYLFGRIVILISAAVFDTVLHSIVNRYVRDLAVYSAGLNSFFLLATSKDFRSSAKKFFGFHGQAVGSLSPATRV